MKIKSNVAFHCCLILLLSFFENIALCDYDSEDSINKFVSKEFFFKIDFPKEFHFSEGNGDQYCLTVGKIFSDGRNIRIDVIRWEKSGQSISNIPSSGFANMIRLAFPQADSILVYPRVRDENQKEMIARFDLPGIIEPRHAHMIFSSRDGRLYAVKASWSKSLTDVWGEALSLVLDSFAFLETSDSTKESVSLNQSTWIYKDSENFFSILLPGDWYEEEILISSDMLFKSAYKIDENNYARLFISRQETPISFPEEGLNFKNEVAKNAQAAHGKDTVVLHAELFKENDYTVLEIAYTYMLPRMSRNAIEERYKFSRVIDNGTRGFVVSTTCPTKSSAEVIDVCREIVKSFRPQPDTIHHSATSINFNEVKEFITLEEPTKSNSSICFDMQSGKMETRVHALAMMEALKMAILALVLSLGSYSVWLLGTKKKR